METSKILLLSTVLVLILVLVGCNKKATVYSQVSLFNDMYTDKSRYSPGEVVEVYISMYNSSDEIHEGSVNVSLVFLDEEILSTSSPSVSLVAGQRKSIVVTFIAPDEDFTGYILKADFLKETTSVDIVTSAVDVSSDWSKFPRYGYLVNFGEKTPTMIDLLIGELNKYHINGLQFYDWQYMHHMPLPFDESGNPLDSWLELSNNNVSYATVEGYINSAHDYNMMAMNYNLLFGTYDNPESDGVNLEWGLYTDKYGNDIDFHSLPSDWQSSKLLIMNPANVDWQNYIINQEQITMSYLDFDGWHVDQLGNRGSRYDYLGNSVGLVTGYLSLMENASATLNSRFVFNAVDGYGQSSIASSMNVDFLYQEVWSSHKYMDLKRIIDSGFVQSDYEKSMILAAYMNYGSRDESGYFNTASVLLTNATIFAAGGAHLELGDTGMLSSEYFPSNNITMSIDLKNQLRSYYDFLVAYENFLRDDVRNSYLKIELGDIRVSVLGMNDSIWYFTKEKDNYQMIHLINILGNETDWRDDDRTKNNPIILENTPMKIYISESVKNLLIASPDVNNGLPMSIDFTVETDDEGETYISFVLPSLEYWDMIILEK